MINKKTLPQDVYDVLENILDKNPADVTSEERLFLKSRIDYLTQQEIDMFLQEAEVVEPILDEPKKTRRVIKHRKPRK